jgi:hypothetical protein
MKLSISLADVRSITPIPEIGVQVRELQVEIPEYDHPRSQGLTADTALPEALAKTKTGTSKIL